MGRIIPKNVLEEIRHRNDIAEVVGSYLPLKRAGGAFKALCPFHKEKTPSFHVNTQRQIFHCFGCGAGGDVFSFLMQYEGVDFVTAARILAERSGLEIELEEGDGANRDDKDLLYRIHEEVATFFHRVLLEMSSAEQARTYLAERQIDEETINTFQFGYAPNRRDTMHQWAEQKNYTLEQLEKAGLVARSDRHRPGESPYYERFRQRLMIPIQDQLGRVIGFTGRVLDKNQSGGKYVNSPETLLFHKGRVLFAFDKARKAIVDQGQAILCEGQIDVIRCHQAGIRNAVASQGTALTEDHVRLLKRYADAVVLVLDPDRAGQDAALRSAPLFLAAGISLQVAALPKGEDPDTMILREGPDAFRKVVQSASHIVDFQVDVLRERNDLTKETHLLQATRSVLETIRHASSAVQRDELLHRAARLLEVREEALRQDYSRLRQPARASTPQPSTPTPSAEAAEPVPPEELALLEALLAYPEVVPLVTMYLPLENITHSACRNMVQMVIDHQSDEKWNLMDAIAEEDPVYSRLAAKVQVDARNVSGDDLTPEHAAQDLILVIRRKKMERRRRQLTAKRDQAEEPEQSRIAAECAQLAYDIKTLQQGWQKALPLLDF